MVDIPMVTIKFGDKTVFIPTIQSESDLVDCLIDEFGAEHVPPGSSLFLKGEKVLEDETRRNYKMKLASVLEKDFQNTVFELEVKAQRPELMAGLPAGRLADASNCHRQTITTTQVAGHADAQLTIQERRRAALVKKGRAQGKKKDAGGNIITSKGQNVQSS
jgi:hypothetical protein